MNQHTSITTDQPHAETPLGYIDSLAEELLNTEDAIAAEHGEHLRVGAPVTWTDPRTGAEIGGVVKSTYRRASGKAVADVRLDGYGPAGVLAEDLTPRTA